MLAAGTGAAARLGHYVKSHGLGAWSDASEGSMPMHMLLHGHGPPLRYRMIRMVRLHRRLHTTCVRRIVAPTHPLSSHWIIRSNHIADGHIADGLPLFGRVSHVVGQSAGG